MRGFARFRKPPHSQKRMQNVGCHLYSVNKAAGPPQRKAKRRCIIQSRAWADCRPEPRVPAVQRCQTETPVLRAVWPWASDLAPLISVICLVMVLIPGRSPS